MKVLSCARDVEFGTAYNRILTINLKKNYGRLIITLQTGKNWCYQSKMCYISIDIHAYMFKYIQI